jgi:hypothetical protein
VVIRIARAQNVEPITIKVPNAVSVAVIRSPLSKQLVRIVMLRLLAEVPFVEVAANHFLKANAPDVAPF